MRLHVAVIVFSLAVADGAAATPITRTFEFIASGFDAGAPVDPLIGSVTVTFDPMGGDVVDQTSVTLNSINVDVDLPVVFTYLASQDELFIGGAVNGASGIGAFTNDFLINIGGASTSAPFPLVLPPPFPPQLFWFYTQSTTVNLLASNGTLTVVPEPGVLLLMGVALVGVLASRKFFAFERDMG